MPENIYDVIVIGGGPCGLTAGMYASRSRLKTLLIERLACGGQSVVTDWIENYPGFPEGISGFELAMKIEAQAKKFDLNIVLEEVVEILDVNSADNKIVKTSEGEYKTSAIIIASGATHKTLDIPGEFEFRGKGVSYCAACDGPFFKDKDVAVIGGGDSAVQEAIYLTRFAKTVTLIHRRDRLRAAKILQERAQSNSKIIFKFNSVPKSINGADVVENLIIINKVSGVEEEIPLSGVFVFVGLIPNTDFQIKEIKADESGYIFSDNNMQTSIPGIFACGDVRHKLLRQVVTAVGEGATAAFAAQEYVEEIKGTSY